MAWGNWLCICSGWWFGKYLGGYYRGFLFAFLQMFGAIFFQVPAYKDVFAFFIIIVIMIIKPTGIIQESAVKRV